MPITSLGIGQGYRVGNQTFMSSELARVAAGVHSSQQRSYAAPAAPVGPSVAPRARTALQRAMAQYAPGGGFGKGIEAGLERGRTKALASGMQSLVSTGLAGTTMAAGLGKKYEEEVAAPTRLRLESMRAERISALEVMLAQMEQSGMQAGLGRISQPMPGRMPQTSYGVSTPAPARAPAAPLAYAKGITPEPLAQRQPISIMQAAATAYKGAPWATFNGQRYEIGASGQVRSPNIPPGLLMAGAM